MSHVIGMAVPLLRYKIVENCVFCGSPVHPALQPGTLWMTLSDQLTVKEDETKTSAEFKK